MTIENECSGANGCTPPLHFDPHHRMGNQLVEELMPARRADNRLSGSGGLRSLGSTVIQFFCGLLRILWPKDLGQGGCPADASPLQGPV